MPNFDDLLTRELERAGRPAAPDLGRVEKEVWRRRARRGVVRRVQAGALTVAVLLGTVGGFVGLSNVFREDSTSAPASTGEALIVERVTSAVDDRPSLWIANPDGSRPRSLVRLAGAPSVAPDGRTIAFIWFDGEGDHPSLATMALSDGVPRRLTAPSIAAGSPEWSPDGRMIAYVRVLPGADSLWVTDAEGSTHRRVPIGDMVEVRSPTWSPDGSTIAFAASREGDSGSLESDVYIFDFGSEQLDQVSGTPDIEEDGTAWSPDGSSIAFTAYERDGGAGPWRSSVWTMTPQDQNLTLVAGHERSFFSPSWAPDSGSLLVSDGDWVYRLDLSDQNGNGQITQLTEGTSAVWQPHAVGSVLPPSPSPTPEPDPEGRDIGLDFRICNVETLGGIDLIGGGPAGRAWTGVPVTEEGNCPQNPFGKVILAVDHTGDGLADSWWGPIEGCDFCRPLGGTDLDADGIDEIVVQNGFSIADHWIFRVPLDEGAAPQVEPILVAPPGHEPAGLQGDEPLVLGVGGDAGYSGYLRCETYPESPILVYTWIFAEVDADTDQQVHESRLNLGDDGRFHVVDTNDFTVPRGNDIPLELSRARACGVDWDLFA